MIVIRTQLKKNTNVNSYIARLRYAFSGNNMTTLKKIFKKTDYVTVHIHCLFNSKLYVKLATFN